MAKDKGDCGCADAASAADAPDIARRQADNLKQYKAHFVDPPAEFAREKAEIFQIERATIEKRRPMFICATAGRWTRYHPIKRFDPTIYQVSDYLHRITPKDLDHLKALAGVPNEVHRAIRERESTGCGPGFRQWPVEMMHLPSEGAIHYNRLSWEQRVAVHDLSLNLLLGPVDAKRALEAPYKAVIDSMLGQVVDLPTFVGKDLLVCPDETVEFTGFGAVHFDNVVVLGNGRILLGGGTKLHAYQIKHA